MDHSQPVCAEEPNEPLLIVNSLTDRDAGHMMVGKCWCTPLQRDDPVAQYAIPIARDELARVRVQGATCRVGSQPTHEGLVAVRVGSR